MGHQWSFGTLHQRFTSFIYLSKVTADLPWIHSRCNCVLKGTQPCTPPSVLWSWSRDLLCHSQPTSLPLTLASYPPWTLIRIPCIAQWVMLSHATFRRRCDEGWVQEPVIKKPPHIGCFQCLKSGLQGNSTEQAGTTTAWFGQKPSLCWAFWTTLSVASQLFLSASGYLYLVITSASKW